VRALRTEGYDVFAASEVMRRSDDRELIEQAYREQRILLTEDKDFGWLVFVSHADSAGVILIRFPGNLRQTLAQVIVQLVQREGERLVEAFVVVQPGHIRIRRKP
jgi:predicted nuclease of predicted toxin-antitoxin system